MLNFKIKKLIKEGDIYDLNSSSDLSRIRETVTWIRNARIAHDSQLGGMVSSIDTF
jgi:hypothetical protein